MAKVEKVCAICGKTFSVPLWRSETAKTCSRGCGGKLTALKYEDARVKKTCPVCRKEFSVPRCHAERTTCCSRKCSDPLKKPNRSSGKNHYNWKGGHTEHSDGYLYVHTTQHPFAITSSYVLEHRLVMESWMRAEAPEHRFLVSCDGVLYLRPEIHVHHINENKGDNRRKNLLACTAASHRFIHHGRPPMQGEVWPEVEGMVAYAPTRVSCSCEVCGSEFLKKRSDVVRGSGKFCSRACYKIRPRKTFDVVPI